MEDTARYRCRYANSCQEIRLGAWGLCRAAESAEGTFGAQRPSAATFGAWFFSYILLFINNLEIDRV